MALGRADKVQLRHARARAMDGQPRQDGSPSAVRCAHRMGRGQAFDRRCEAPTPGGRFPDGPLRGIIAEVAHHLGLDAAAATWQRTPDSEGYNDRRFASYRLVVPGTDGRTALGFWARFQLPDGLQSTVISMVDMRVDFAAVGVDHGQTVVKRVDPTHRLSDKQLQRFFTAGWLTVARLLPLAATDDPRAPRPAGPTTIELHID